MGSGVTNFLSVVEARSLGTADIDKMAAAIDKQSAALDNLGKKANAVSEHKGFSGFADKIKQGITDPLGAVEQVATKALESMGPIGAVTAGFATALGALAFAGFKAAESLAAYGQQIENTGLRTGLTTKEVVQFGFAARLVDQDVSVFDRTMRGLTAALTDNSAAGAKARDALRDLGVTPRTLNGDLKPTGQILTELSAALGSIPNAIDRNKVGMEIFKRAWVEIAPAILKLNEGVKIANREGLWGPNQQQLEQWDAYDRRTTVALAKWDLLIRKAKEYIALNFLPEENYYENLRQKSGGVSGPDAPGAPQSSIASALFGGDAARVNADRAAGNALLNSARGRIDNTLDGLRFKAEAAKQKYEEAYNSIRTLSDVGAQAAQKEIDSVSSLRKTYEGLNEQLKLAEKNEAARLALLEKAQTLRSQGQGFLQFGGGTNGFIVTQQQITAANQQRGRGPSLFRSGEFSAESFAAQNSLLTQPDLAAGTDFQGNFVSPSSQRNVQVGDGSTEQLNARSLAISQRRNSTEQSNLAMLGAEANFAAQIVELRAGPGGELAAARAAAGIREAALQNELAVTQDINAYREKSQQNQLEFEMRVAELQRKRLDDLRNTGAQLFDAALGGGSGLANFGKNFLLGQGRALAGNAFAELFKNVSGNIGLGGKVFQGTIFGQDPLKGATDMNTMATLDNTRAMMAFSARIAASASGGGGGLVGGLEGISGIGGDSAPDSYLGGGDWGDGTILPAKTGGGGFSLGRALGIGGAAAGGGFGIYSGIKAGGGRGATTAAASAIAMAGSIIALSSKALAIAGPIGLLAGTGIGIIASAIFGDPKKNRASDIDAELQAARYTAPSSSTYTMDRFGRSFDMSTQGGLRVNIVVQTLDSKSFEDNAPQLVEALNRHIEARLSPRFESNIRRMALPR